MSSIISDEDMKKRREIFGDKSAVENMFNVRQPAVLGEFSNRCEIEIGKDGEASVYPVINGEKPRVSERGVVAGLVHCDEFGIPFDENYSENKNIHLDGIGRGIIGNLTEVDVAAYALTLINQPSAEIATVGTSHGIASFPIASYRAEHYSPVDIGRGNIHPSFQNFGSIDEMTDYTYQDMMARKAVPFAPASYSLRKFSDDELRENIMTMNHAITKDAVIEEKAKLRDHSYSFMLAKDKNKIDFKIYINSIFRKDEKDIKNKFIKDLYSTKILYKEFKHLNFAAKRLVVNNRLRANIIDYCSNTESAANDILVLLENDSSNFDYLFKHLQPAIRKMIDRGIAL